MAGPLQTTLTSMLSTMDNQTIDRKHTSGSDPIGSLYSMLQPSLPHEAQMVREAWMRFRAALDQALAKATSSKL